MARLPQPGGDAGNWGSILNDYLSTSHKSDGTLKDNSIGSAQLQDNSVTTAAIADDSITNTKLANDAISKDQFQPALRAELDAKITQATADTSYAPVGDYVEGAEASSLRDDVTEAVGLARTATYGSVQDTVGSQLRFVKSESNPIFATGDTSLPSIYWPSVMNVEGKIANPLGKYYLWFSTDHDSASGRIALATADDLEGQWTQRGVVWQYSTSPGGSGTESETPSVVWDYQNDRFIMYHQQVGPTGAVAAQVTMAVTSPDGLAWTSVGIVLDIRQASTWRAPAHTGYFRAFYVGNGYVGYSLMQGQEAPSFAIWRSRDGLAWQVDARPLGYGAEFLPSNRRIEWNTSNVILWRGQYLWVGLISSFNSGAEARATYYAVAPLSADFRSFVSPPQKLFDPDQAWESNNMGQGHAFIDDGRLVLVYRSGDGTTEAPYRFGVAFAAASNSATQSLDMTGETIALSLNRDASGRFIPDGRVEQVASWSPMLDVTLPAWLAVQAGTGAGQTMAAATNPARYTLSTAATVNAGARIWCPVGIIPAQYEEIEWTVHGLSFTTDATFNFRFELGSTGQDRGIDYRQNNGEVGGRFRTHITNSATFVDRARAPYFSKSDGGGRRPTSWTLLWRPQRQEAYVLMDDQVMAAMKYDPTEVSLTAAVNAMFTIETTTAEVKTARFNRVDLKLRHN